MKIDIDFKTILILLLLFMAIYQDKVYRLYHIIETLMNNDSMFGNVVNRITQKFNPHSFIHSTFTPQRPITRGYGHQYHSHHGGYHRHYDRYYPEETYYQHEPREIIPYQEQHLTCQNGLYMLYFNNKPFITGINPLLFQDYNEYLHFVSYKHEMGEPYPVLKCKHNDERESIPAHRHPIEEHRHMMNDDSSNTEERAWYSGYGMNRVGTANNNKVFFDPPPVDTNNNNHNNKQTSIYEKTQENKDLGNSNNFKVTYTPNISDDGEIKPINPRLSDNAMESNWGGVVYSQNHVNGGYYL